MRTRLHGLWLLREGRTLGAVAEVVGVPYRTVRARKMGGTGQAPFLTPEQEAEVAAAVETGRFGTGNEIRAWIAGRFGVAYTLGGLYSLLERLGCRPKVPRPVHAKADPAAQEAFKKGGSRKRSRRRA